MSSFNWSQTLLTHPMTPSFGERQSQDSGIEVQNYGVRQPQLFPPATARRTLPKPPSLPNLRGNEPGRWKFSRQNQERQQGSQELQLMRDMHSHLLEIDGAITGKMTQKMSTIVKECVKHLQTSNTKQSEKSKLIMDELKTSTETLLELLSASVGELTENVATVEKMLLGMKSELTRMRDEQLDLDEKLELASKSLRELSEKMENSQKDANLFCGFLNRESMNGPYFWANNQLGARSSPSFLPPVRMFHDIVADAGETVIIKGEKSDKIDSCQ